METTDKATGIKLKVSFLGKGAPSNRSGGKIGIGSSAAKANENAGHWNNQAPWAIERSFSLVDGQPGWHVGQVICGQTQAAAVAAADGLESLFQSIRETPAEHKDQADHEALALWDRGAFASAVRLVKGL